MDKLLRESSLIAALRRPSRLQRVTSATLFMLMVAALFYGSAKPANLPLVPPSWDKLVHLSYYAALTVLLIVAGGGRGALLAALVVIGVGAADELFQSTVPQRQADWLDFVADIGGALIAAAGYSLLVGGRSTRTT